MAEVFAVDCTLAVMLNTKCWWRASLLDCSQVVHILGIVVDPSFELVDLNTWRKLRDLNSDGENNTFSF